MHYFSNLFWYRTLHVSDRFTVHSQESSTIQGVPGGKDNILGGHSKQKTLYEHVSYSERFPR
jgi:hypothetical protein